MGTCPTCCPLKSNGCYADGGPLLLHWKKVSDGERGDTWGVFLQKIAALPEGQLWRHNQSGDLVPQFNSGELIHADYLTGLVEANRGKRGFTYTHYPVLQKDTHLVVCEWNRQMIQYANENGFTINLSANDLRNADDLWDLNVAPVTTNLPSDQVGKSTFTPKGRKVVVCPAALKDNIHCDKCGLCAKYPRQTIIGFPAHGFKKSSIDRFIQLAEEVNG